MKTVRHILNWYSNEPDAGEPYYTAELEYMDGSTEICALTVHEFEMAKSDEFTAELAELNANVTAFGLCAWCKSYFNRETGRPVHVLTNEQFEATKHNSTSHGICADCKKAQTEQLTTYACSCIGNCVDCKKKQNEQIDTQYQYPDAAGSDLDYDEFFDDEFFDEEL